MIFSGHTKECIGIQEIVILHYISAGGCDVLREPFSTSPTRISRVVGYMDETNPYTQCQDMERQILEQIVGGFQNRAQISRSLEDHIRRQKGIYMSPC